MILGNYQVDAIVVNGKTYLHARNLLTYEEEREQIKAVLETTGEKPAKRERGAPKPKTIDNEKKFDIVIDAYEIGEEASASKHGVAVEFVKQLIKHFEEHGGFE